MKPQLPSGVITNEFLEECAERLRKLDLRYGPAFEDSLFASAFFGDNGEEEEEESVKVADFGL